MKVHLIGQTDPKDTRSYELPLIKARGYSTARYGASTSEAVSLLLQPLIDHPDHRFAATEMKQDFAPERDGYTKLYSHSSAYALLDQDERALVLLHSGLAKGYDGEGARGALLVDVYLDLLGLPVKRVVATRNRRLYTLRKGEERIIEMPEPVQPHFDLQNIPKARRRIRDSKLGDCTNLSEGVDKLVQGMTLEHLLTHLGKYDR